MWKNISFVKKNSTHVCKILRMLVLDRDQVIFSATDHQC